MRLARQVFAPHYAAASLRVLTGPAALRASRDAGAEVVASLKQGDRFELLDLIGQDGWGVAPDAGLVGYLDAGLLAEPTG